jgi:hypothetical protein
MAGQIGNLMARSGWEGLLGSPIGKLPRLPDRHCDDGLDRHGPSQFPGAIRRPLTRGHQWQCRSRDPQPIASDYSTTIA